MNSPEQSETPIHSFETEGMNTVFKFRLEHPDRDAARKLAGACIRQLEELEAELSRYRHDSEVTRINLMEAGESMLLSDATYRCLQKSLEATQATAGLFDATLGMQTRAQQGAPSPPIGRLELSPDRPQIRCEEAGRQIDLGGIGKGFALDELANMLTELGVTSALLSCGASTHLALGSRCWPFQLGKSEDSPMIDLKGQALSSSGTGEQGAHVVHPDTGDKPNYSFKRVWITGKSAALSDAFSTACLIMDQSELEGFAIAHPQALIYAENAEDGLVQKFG